MMKQQILKLLLSRRMYRRIQVGAVNDFVQREQVCLDELQTLSPSPGRSNQEAAL